MSQAVEMKTRFRLLPEDRYLGWTPYVWLIYLPTLFMQLAFGGASRVGWVLTLISVAVFLPLYFRSYWARENESYVIIAAMAALGIILVPFNGAGFVFFVYAAAFAGTRRPTRQALRIFGILTAIVLVEAFLLHLPLWSWVWAAVFIWIIGGVNTHFETVRESNKQLQRAHEEIEHLATMAERERIARDLHDLLGHTLSLITLKSSLASRLADRDPARAIAEIRDVERISREALSEVRSAVAGYREAGLARAVASAEQMLTAAGIKPTLQVEAVPLATIEEGVLALAVREAVTNVVKHSRAKACSIQLTRVGDVRRLSIVDDGVWKGTRDGNGLVGMRERVEAIGGELLVIRENGTSVVIELRDGAIAAGSISPSEQSLIHIVA